MFICLPKAYKLKKKKPKTADKFNQKYLIKNVKTKWES